MKIDGVEPIIQVLLSEIVAKLQQAEQIARAAHACACAGSVPESIQVSMDLDQAVYEIGRLHDAVTLLGRLGEN